MVNLSHHDIAVFFLALGILLATARFLGEVAMRFQLPAVLGEILAGIILGPTILGSLTPSIQTFIFPTTGLLPVAFQGLMTLAITLFLLVAGMEVDLSSVFKQGRASLLISFLGIVIPFSFGFALAWFFTGFFGAEAAANRFIFALFMGTALSISALPVIAKTMMDLNLYRTDLGMVIISSAIIDDLAGWFIFALILGRIGQGAVEGILLSETIILTLLFIALILTVGRWLLNRILPWLQAHTSWPGGILGFAFSIALLCASFTEWIGIHAIFGAFFFGIALGDSKHLRERTRATIAQFISFFFAPLFFASIGLKVNFAAHFDFWLVMVVIVVATAGKVIGCTWGARLSGLEKQESLAIGFGMNARGAMEIILGLLALQFGIIHEKTFVALVIMALVTSIMSGSMLKRILQKKKAVHFWNFSPAKNFSPRLQETSAQGVIRELAKLAVEGTSLNLETINKLVWKREETFSTGLENSLAIPHASVKDLPAPIIAVGVSAEGVDFDAPDGQLARLIFLILTPKNDPTIQLDLISDIVRSFIQSKQVEKATDAKTFTEFLAVIKSETPEAQH